MTVIIMKIRLSSTYLYIRAGVTKNESDISIALMLY